jgi:hypothetical protein
VSRRRNVTGLGLPTREELRVFRPPVSALLAYYLVTSPRRLPEDEQTRNELVNFINELRANLQVLGVNSDGSQR